MLRLPVSHLLPALLAALPLAALAQAPADSVVRTTVTTVTTTTTVTKPASAGRPVAPATSSSSSSTSTTSTTTAAPIPARQPGPGDLAGARPRATTAPVPTAAAKAAPTPATRPKATTSTAASRPASAAPAARASTASATTAARRSTTPADPELAHLLQTDVDPAKVSADQLPNLYERFLETTRTERRQWSSTQWVSAGAALSRLNQRYEQVRGDLSLEDKLNIRTLQGEFRTLEAAKQVSKRL